MVKTYTSFEFAADDEAYALASHRDMGKPYERHALTLYIRDTSYQYSVVGNSSAPSISVAYATPEQIDAHIAALQELRATWPTPEPPVEDRVEVLDIPTEEVIAAS